MDEVIARADLMADKEIGVLFNETSTWADWHFLNLQWSVKRFEQTGSIKNRAKPGRPATAASPDKALNVLLLLSKVGTIRDSTRYRFNNSA